MKIIVKFFGPAQSWAQTQEMPMYLPQPVALREIKAQLADMFVGLRERMEQTALALNEEIAEEHTKVKDGDEVAVLPPICGGAQTVSMLTEEPLDAGNLMREASRPAIGAMATFVGITRADEKDENGKKTRVRSLYYEAYSPMAAKALEKITRELCKRHDLEALHLVHRVGDVPAGEASVVIVASSGHRRSALDAVAEAIERVKKEVPLWKKEIYEDGTTRWQEGIPIVKAENNL